MDTLLEDVVRAYCASKIQREHILNQNGANMVYNHGRDMANKLNVGNPPASDDANQRLGITPFPHSSETNTIQLPPDSKPTSPWQTAGLVALSAIAGAGGFGAASSFFGKEPTQSVQVTQTEPQVSEPSMGEVDVEVR